MPSFQGVQRRQCGFLQLVFEVAFQCGAIRDEPCLHAGCHGQYLFICRPFWPCPLIPRLQMSPCGFQVCERFFAVNRQREENSSGAAVLGYLERIIRRATPPARDQARHSFFGGKSAILQQLSEALATADVHFFRVRARAATLNIDIGTHQRVPPSWPFVHNCPRRYLASHSVKSSLFKRRISVFPSFFSHTTTASGRSVMASTRMSEWVVTIS